MQSKDVPRYLSDVNGPDNWLSPWHYDDPWWYMHLRPYPQGAWLTLPTANADSQTTWHHLQQLKVSDQAASNCLLQCYIHCTRHAARSHHNPSPPRPSHSWFPGQTLVLSGPNQLPTALYIWFVHQNYIFMWTVSWVGLEPLDGCGLLVP